MNFHLPSNPEKIISRLKLLIFFHLGPILPIFWAKISFLKKWVVRFCDYLPPCEKTRTNKFAVTEKNSKLTERQLMAENSNFKGPYVYLDPIIPFQ